MQLIVLGRSKNTIFKFNYEIILVFLPFLKLTFLFLFLCLFVCFFFNKFWFIIISGTQKTAFISSENINPEMENHFCLFWGGWIKVGCHVTRTAISASTRWEPAVIQSILPLSFFKKRSRSTHLQRLMKDLISFLCSDYLQGSRNLFKRITY